LVIDKKQATTEELNRHKKQGKKFTVGGTMKRSALSRKLARFIPLLILIFVSLLSHVLLTGFSTFKHEFFYPIQVYEKITIDVYGAVLPTLLSVSFIVLYFTYFKGSFLRIFGCFLFAFALFANSFTLALTDHGFGLQTVPGTLALFISPVSIVIIFFDERALKAKALLSSISSGLARNYVVALLATFSASSLSVLFVDLIFAPFLNQEPLLTTVDIGGGGLTDGVLFSGLFALVWTTFFVSVLALFIEIVRLSERKDHDYKESK